MDDAVIAMLPKGSQSIRDYLNRVYLNRDYLNRDYLNRVYLTICKKSADPSASDSLAAVACPFRTSITASPL